MPINNHHHALWIRYGHLARIIWHADTNELFLGAILVILKGRGDLVILGGARATHSTVGHTVLYPTVLYSQ